MTSKRDHSYGIIPLQKRNDGWYVLLVQLHAGHWGFPKGHPDAGETPLESAKREFLEETGLTVSRLFDQAPLEEHYFFKHEGVLINKTVTYFMAEVEGNLVIQELEIKAAAWVPLHEAPNTITFTPAKEIIEKVTLILK